MSGGMNAFSERDFHEVCGNFGWRRTAQREAVFRFIVGNRSHPSVEEVWRAVRRRLPAISLDTVYRVLDEFFRAGICGRFEHGEKMIYDGNASVHGHFFCLNCGKISDFDFPPELLRRAGELGEIVGREVGCSGVCRECLSAGMDFATEKKDE